MLILIELLMSIDALVGLLKVAWHISVSAKCAILKVNCSTILGKPQAQEKTRRRIRRKKKERAREREIGCALRDYTK